MEIRPIKRESLSENVVKQLKEMIAGKELVPGQKLPSEQELAEYFRVGRHTVREALKKMAVMGLVESRVGQGSYITKIMPRDVLGFMTNQLVMSRVDIKNLMELRKLLELKIVTLAAKRATEKDLKEVEYFLQQMHKRTDSGRNFVDEDIKFHFAIANATQNEYFGVVLNSIRDMLSIVQEKAVVMEGAMERALNFHQQILNAIKNNDPKSAEVWMEKHMEDTETAILKGNK